jgi:predicted transcriptional regulator
MKNRSKTDIVAAILQAAAANGNNLVGKSRIMYEAYLSWSQLEEYLSLLIAKDLIEYQKESHVYRTTEKGNHLLRLYNQLNELIIVQDQIRKVKVR